MWDCSEDALAMQLLYNSDSYVVVQFELPATEAAGAATRGGYEIVDKFARKEIFLAGALAEQFEAGVKALMQQQGDEEPSAEVFDDYIAGFTVLAQQPVLMH
jgi:hypothetical protein